MHILARLHRNSTSYFLTWRCVFKISIIERRVEAQNISQWTLLQSPSKCTIQLNRPWAKNSGKTDQNNKTNCENDDFDNDGLNQDPTSSAGKEPFHQLMI